MLRVGEGLLFCALCSESPSEARAQKTESRDIRTSAPTPGDLPSPCTAECGKGGSPCQLPSQLWRWGLAQVWAPAALGWVHAGCWRLCWLILPLAGSQAGKSKATNSNCLCARDTLSPKEGQGQRLSHEFESLRNVRNRDLETCRYLLL